MAAIPDFVGLQDEYLLHGGGGYRSANLGAMAQIGVGTIRQAFLWRDMEPTRGHFDLKLYDAFVASAADKGLTVLPVVFGPPKFRMKAGPAKYTCPPSSNAAFARFAAKLARRYGTDGTFWRRHPGIPNRPITAWQIWNEPNIRPYWCGRPDAREYVAMLRAASRALKRADPAAEVVTAGMPQSRLGIPLTTFVRQMYAAGGRSAFDTLAVHPYQPRVAQLVARLRAVRRVMDAHGDRAARIWATEFSWSDAGPAAAQLAGIDGQGRLIAGAVKTLGRLRGSLRLRGMIYVFWRDLDPYPPAFKDFWSLHTGLLRRDGSAKPSYEAFRGAVSTIR